jgi:hypothetical protein
MRSLFSTLVFLAVIFLLVGWWRGWITFTKQSDADRHEVGVGVILDKEKAKEDADKLGQKADQAVKQADNKKSQTGPDTTKGTISSIDSNRRLVVRTTNNTEVKIEVDASTRITLNDSTAAFTDLRVGDEATVTYEPREGRNIAKSVTALHRNGAAGPQR